MEGQRHAGRTTEVHLQGTMRVCGEEGPEAVSERSTDVRVQVGEFSCDPRCYFKVVASSYLIMNEIAFEDSS